MENTRKCNYISNKFGIDNIKRDKATILAAGGALAGFGLLESRKELVFKEYYDTPNFFFSENGITINKNVFKGSNVATLVVRYQTEKQRIEFLSDMPDVFELKINKKDSIFKYVDYITECIGELAPYGLNVDVKKTLFGIVNVFTSKKQRETYKYISFSGLKITLAFCKNKYYTNLNRNCENMLMLEIDSENVDKKPEYDAFIKKLKFNYPNLIELESSDYLLGKSLLFK